MCLVVGVFLLLVFSCYKQFVFLRETVITIMHFRRSNHKLRFGINPLAPLGDIRLGSRL